MEFQLKLLKNYSVNLFVSTTFFKDKTPIDEALDLCEKYSINNIELGSKFDLENGI